jgi:hypothetical protein
MRHCLIPISLALTLAIAQAGCGDESDEVGLESCQSYCETFFIKYGECVEAMNDDTRSTAISTCFEEIEAQSAEGGVSPQIQGSVCASQEADITAMDCGEFGEAYSY